MRGTINLSKQSVSNSNVSYFVKISEKKYWHQVWVVVIVNDRNWNFQKITIKSKTKTQTRELLKIKSNKHGAET